ncbi:MAG: BACON domain-containing protein [Deltaproteobacteria bacterium]|nr:BACON domain-containing protein [Deltaproteobacteria bacterium]
MTVFKSKTIIAAVFAAILMFGGLPVLFAQVDQPVQEAPILSVTPDRVDLGILRDTETGVTSIEISNRGQGKIKWMVKWTEPWLTLDKYFGVVEDGTQVVSVTADPSDLPLGRNKAEIVITSSGGTIIVPVSVTVLRDNNAMYRPELEEIRLTSITNTQVGRKIQMSTVGIYSDGSKRDITKKIKWISKNKRTGYFVDKGLFIGKKKGDVRVFAKKGGVKSPVVTIHINALDGPLLKVSMPKIRLDHMEKDSIENISMTLRNAGKGELEWEVINITPWLVLNDGTSSGGAGRQMASESRWYSTNIAGTDVEENAPDRQKSEYSSSLRGTGRKTVKIAVDVTGLPEGRYEGTILIRSNGGDEEIIIPVNILSLESISVVPVSVRMTVNHRMAFRATGIWSNGNRTDLSGGLNGRWTVSDPSVGYFLRRRPVFVAKRVGRAEIRKVRGGVISNVAIVDVEEDVAGSVLMVSPREVDLGTIGPGESSKGVVSLRNVGGGDLIWLVYSMGDWISPYDDMLSGTAGMSARHLRISIESVTEEGVSVNGLFPVRVRFETGHNSVSYEKLLSPGSYREELKLFFNGGERTVFLKFEVAKKGSRPCMDVRPLGIDFGSVETGRKLIRRIELRNVGKDVLKWKAMLQGKRKNFRGVALERGRYVSFANESVSRKGSYSVPGHLKNALEISGEWSEEKGYPHSTGDNDLLRYSFSGSGIVLFLWKDIYGGTLDVFLDNRMIGEIDCASEERKRIEFPVAESLADGEPHLLVLKVRGGTVEVEGVRVYTAGLVEGRKGLIRISPEKGTTTNEVDYINVTANTGGLFPGLYSENIIFYSGEEVEIVEVALDVKSDNLSSDVAREDFPLEGYRKGKLAFRLFRKDTPGTTEFFQWHNPSSGTHFYSYSRSGGKHSLKGYVSDGTIGNIATLKLPRTRDLYRWFNPETGAYFYTTDTKGEGREKLGYVGSNPCWRTNKNKGLSKMLSPLFFTVLPYSYPEIKFQP